MFQKYIRVRKKNALQNDIKFKKDLHGVLVEVLVGALLTRAGLGVEG